MPEAIDRAQGDREQALADLIAQCPLIADYLSQARRVRTGPYGEIRVRKDYSYIQERFWRPGLVLAGDAACFIDPVFSSGVHLATYSGLLAARSLNSSLLDDTHEQIYFEEFESRYRREYSVFHDFLVAFYDMHQDEDSYFWKAKKVTNSNASELESFVELVGGGASSEDALVDPGSYLERRAVAFRELSDIADQPVREAGEDRNLLQAALARSVAKEGTRIQVQAVVGGNADERIPVRAGGLIPSPDGLHWSAPEAGGTAG